MSPWLFSPVRHTWRVLGEWLELLGNSLLRDLGTGFCTASKLELLCSQLMIWGWKQTWNLASHEGSQIWPSFCSWFCNRESAFQLFCLLSQSAEVRWQKELLRLKGLCGSRVCKKWIQSLSSGYLIPTSYFCAVVYWSNVSFLLLNP